MASAATSVARSRRVPGGQTSCAMAGPKESRMKVALHCRARILLYREALSDVIDDLLRSLRNLDRYRTLRFLKIS